MLGTSLVPAWIGRPTQVYPGHKHCKVNIFLEMLQLFARGMTEDSSFVNTVCDVSPACDVYSRKSSYYTGPSCSKHR